MNDFVHNLPPQFEECVKRDLQGYLEIEVSYISFVTKIIEEENSESAKPPSSLWNGKILLNNNCVDNTKNIKEFPQSLQNICGRGSSSEQHKKQANKSVLSNIKCVQVKIVWFGEDRAESVANILVSCETLSSKRAKPQHQQLLRKKKNKHCQYFVVSSSSSTSASSSVAVNNNKLRYRICTSVGLFLDYLRSCKPIQIIVSSNSSSTTAANNNNSNTLVLGQTQLRLPSILLRKFAFNIARGHKSFEHKSKIYTLYQRQQEEQQQANSSIKKSGEIQLRFKMMFAAPAAAATVVSMPLTTKHGGLHDKHHLHHHHHIHHHNAHMMVSKTKVAEPGDKSKRLSTQTKSEEIVEAMKKLDAKLVAYLAGETEITSKIPEEVVHDINLNDSDEQNITTRLDDLSPATKLNIFKTIHGIKLEMEALTLQPEGTKSMNLMASEIRPIFTVECQFSNELIKKVPRSDMFHIIQFESEKFQSLTQCTRFGQKDERAVKLDLDENGNELSEINLGRIYFTVWWREPGTCLNEMLGMGTLELSDLYNASLLEQCKRIEIQRRGRHLACLYFKITLQRNVTAANNILKKRNVFLPKQSSCDSDSDDKTSASSSAADKQNVSTSNAAQQPNQNQNNLATDKSSTEKGQNNNSNKLQVAQSHFDDETTKIRLLKGFIYANEARNLELQSQPQKFLICRRFWLDEPVAAKADDGNKFNYQEQFSVINDDKFLQRVDKQYLHLELWQRMSSDDGNGNCEENLQAIGMVRIPLHQFYIAYRDAAITNHLCKGKLPVISIDAWAPIINWESGLKIGELKCLLAVGSEEQIKNLKDTRGFSITFNSEMATSLQERKLLQNLKPLQIASTSKNVPPPLPTANKAHSNLPAKSSAAKLKNTSDLLDMLNKVLMTPQPQSGGSPDTTMTAQSAAAASSAASSTLAITSSASPSLKPLQQSNLKLFKFSLEIQKALGLPLNPAAKSKKGAKQRNASKKFPPNEAPNTYVTFQAEAGPYATYKSHEGMVYATTIVEKSCQPQWQQRYRLSATIDYLYNPQKRFILKVWKKSALDLAQGRTQPTPIEDAIIGFAALDLTVFTKGLHIAGRFNIVDFNGRINGQLEIRCHPLEEIPATNMATVASTAQSAGDHHLGVGAASTTSVDSVIDQFEQTLDLAHLNLGQAIKRKFTELEGISQRLRARLGDVTGTEIPLEFNAEQLDTWQPLSADANDNDLDEFERDLNTPVAEDDEENNDGGDGNEKQLKKNKKKQGTYESSPDGPSE
uniref:Uncharacterized protein n=2 Tax=Musca domestica TaxID=7370 RepID=A0A1I8MHG9_MUSDO